MGCLHFGIYYPNDHSTKSLSLDPHKVTLSHTPHSYYNKDGVRINEYPNMCLSSRNSFNNQDIYCPDFLFTIRNDVIKGDVKDYLM